MNLYRVTVSHGSFTTISIVRAATEKQATAVALDGYNPDSPKPRKVTTNLIPEVGCAEVIASHWFTAI